MIDPATIDLAQFLRRWYGPPHLLNSEPPTIPDFLPAPLREWYDLRSRWARLLNHNNVMVVLSPDEFWVEGGKTVFLHEHAGDGRWAFDSSDDCDDPVVFEADTLAEPAAMKTCPEKLRECLTHAALFNAIYDGTARVGRRIPQQDVPDLVAPLTQIAFGGWRWPDSGYRMYMNDEVIVMVSGTLDGWPWHDPTQVEVKVSALSEKAIAYLDNVPSWAHRKERAKRNYLEAMAIRSVRRQSLASWLARTPHWIKPVGVQGRSWSNRLWGRGAGGEHANG